MADSSQRVSALNSAPSQAGPSAYSTGRGTSGGAYSQPSDPSESKPKRTQISVACEVCRKRKAKCDGMRPTCTPCQTRNLPCEYVADPDATRMTTLKRKYQALEDSLTAFEALFTFLQRAPSEDAMQVYQRIRAGAAIEDALQATQPIDATQLGNGARKESHAAVMDATPGDLSPSESEHSISHTTSSVRHRMNVNAILATDSRDRRESIFSTQAPPGRRESSPYVAPRPPDMNR